ncbi:nucleotide pyrophosphohydrolase [Peribacillus frigoritolerans]|uniref:nucleotide pyrophosphohydrolase n=1 Tax=Peribacillus frigoritolerans TaxID=450367 RepID=UPI0025712006|nr:nucleotide pyrophosphohydrolase [Peribacillus frigoritolerans]WJE49903.1 nucleotide pyrophosphohydrolase [Peribacillus frigoritolerans]
MNEIKELTDKVIQFRDNRNWKQFHNPKDLAISLSLEASELLENFQWKNSEEALSKNKENIKDELADVIIYSMLLANDLNVDIAEIVNEKIEKNNIKYPVEKAFGVKTKYTDL